MYLKCSCCSPHSVREISLSCLFWSRNTFVSSLEWETKSAPIFTISKLLVKTYKQWFSKSKVPIKIYTRDIYLKSKMKKMNMKDTSFTSTNASLHRPWQIGAASKNATLLTDWFQTRGDPVKPKYLKHSLWNRFKGSKHHF